MSVGLASLCVAGIAYVVSDVLNYRTGVEDRIELLAERIATRWQLLESDPAKDVSWAQGLEGDESVETVYLLDPHGDGLATYVHEDDPAPEQVPEPDMLHLQVRRDVFRAGVPLGTVVVQASPRPLWGRVKTHSRLFLALAGVSALITLAMSRRIHHRFSDQLLDLAHAANAISTRKDYSIRAVRRSDDEIGILVDTFNHMITQIELRDQQLKAEVKRAEAARIAKSQFLATMSHEIRTPINGVLGMTQLLLDTPLSGEQTEFAETIHKSAESLLSIINDILDFSKGEAGRYEVEEIPFSPAKVLDECLDTVSIVAAEKRLELVLEVDDRLPSQVKGDPSRLRQVLLNLLSNALKFTSKGEIVLRVQMEEHQGKHVRIRFEVQDTGIGIPQDRIDRLFQSFSQVDASRSRKYGGTGLGLAISKQIIEAMGGTMFVKTEAGVGSTFGFKLQLAIAAAAEAQEPQTTPQGLRILVADPSPTSGASLSKLLRDGNTVELASDVAGTRLLLINAMQGGRSFDLFLLDLRLAEGLKELDTIGAETLAKLPLVILAPVNQLAAAASLNWTGRKAAIAKPVKRLDLLWCIVEVLRGPLPAPPAGEKAPAVEAQPEESPRPAAPARSLHVLVAEDHPVNQRITTRFLDKLGATWKLAANGQEALEAFKQFEFDVLLMDVQMPVMDGLETTLAIRKLEALRGTHLPIIALTANVLEEHRREAQLAGFDDYLAKPVGLEELRTRLNKWAPPREERAPETPAQDAEKAASVEQTATAS